MEKDRVVQIAEEAMAQMKAENEAKDAVNKPKEETPKVKTPEVEPKKPLSEGSDAEPEAQPGKEVNQEGDGLENVTDEDYDEHGRLNEQGKRKVNENFRKETQKRKEAEARAKDAEQRESSLQSQIDELKSMIKQQKQDIDNRFNPPERIAEEKVKKALLEQKQKHLEEDKSLAIDQRREIAKEELDDWFAEDPVSAQKWIVRHEMRIDKEARKLLESEIEQLQKPEKTLDDQRNEAEERVIRDNPDVDFIKRGEDLKRQGKTAEEIAAVIFGTRDKPGEFPVLLEVYKKNPKKYESVNGLELLVADYKTAGKKPITEDEAVKIRQEAAEAERKRIVEADTGITSTRTPSAAVKLTEQQSKAAKAAGMTDEEYLRAIKAQKERAGAYS